MEISNMKKGKKIKIEDTWVLGCIQQHISKLQYNNAIKTLHLC